MGDPETFDGVLTKLRASDNPCSALPANQPQRQAVTSDRCRACSSRIVPP